MSATTAPLASRWGPHLKALADVDGVVAVDSPAVHEVRVRALEVSRARGLLVVEGPAGVGKSFAVGRAAEDCADDPRRACQTVWVELSGRIRGRALLAELYHQVLDDTPPAGATSRQLIEAMHQALGERPRLLVLDEAQHVGREAMLVLRWLLDQPDSDFALVIVGMHGLWRQLAPELRSRCMTRLQFGRLAGDAVASILAAYHPLFAASDPSLLEVINRTRAHGEFRWWALFLARAWRYAPALGVDRVTDELVELICEAMG